MILINPKLKYVLAYPTLFLIKQECYTLLNQARYGTIMRQTNERSFLDNDSWALTIRMTKR